MRPLLLALVLIACNGDDPTDETDVDTDIQPVDADGDGFNDDVDCNDSDAAINPGADEICNERDDNCDDVIDTDAIDRVEVFTDDDDDGFGDPTTAELVCEAAANQVENNTDCDDSDDEINPDATEVCDDADVDEDCDGQSDDLDDSVDLSTGTVWFRDTDGDGFGDPGASLRACDVGAGRTADNTDCDDTDAEKNPRDGCVGPFDGTWDVQADFTISSREIGVLSCTGTGEFEIEEGASVEVTADDPWICVGIPGDPELSWTGAFDDDDSISGRYTLEGESFDYAADFSGNDLVGKGSESRIIDDINFTVSYELTGTRR
ncbi:MAG: putative metal-binding motif-containing protein [Myxococcota bacterium]